MSNTLKFGNGQWAVKEGSALAYNDENDNFKPLPFTFDRSTSATRINKQGLIEVVPNNEPRIDFLNDSKGALLLEPARNNRLLQSNQFDTTWTLSTSIGLTSGQSGVFGSNNAWLLKKSGSGARYVQQTLSLSSAQYSCSFYLKAESTNWAIIWCYDGATASEAYFDLENGVVGATGGSNFNDATIESVGGGWYRCTLTYTSATTFVRVYPAFANGSVGVTTDDGIYIQYAQLEQGSYPTSYIPTQGSIGTRDFEGCEQNLSNQVSLTEGVFYVDVTNLGRTQNANILTQNSTSNSVYGYIQTNNRIVFGLFANSVSVPITSSLEYEIGTRTKIAFHYKSGNSKLYVNGSLVGNSTDTFTLGSSFGDGIRLIDNASAYFAFPEKSILQEFKIYNKALTNQELINLTKI